MPKSIQKAMFQSLKGGLLPFKRMSPGMQKAAFCAVKDRLLGCNRRHLSLPTAKIGGFIGVFFIPQILFCDFRLSKFLNFNDA